MHKHIITYTQTCTRTCPHTHINCIVYVIPTVSAVSQSSKTTTVNAPEEITVITTSSEYNHMN